MSMLKKIFLFALSSISALFGTNTYAANEFDGCFDRLNCDLNSQAFPSPYLSEDELATIYAELFTSYDEYLQASSFMERKLILDKIKASISVLHQHGYADTDMIILASEIDSKICHQEN